MRKLIWKLRYAFYLSRLSTQSFIWCYSMSENAIDNNPEDMYSDGPKYYAEQELLNWYD